MFKKCGLSFFLVLLIIISVFGENTIPDNQNKIKNDIKSISRLVSTREYGDFASYLNSIYIEEITVVETLNHYGHISDYSPFRQIFINNHYYGFVNIAIDDDILERNIDTDCEYAISLFYNLFESYLNVSYNYFGSEDMILRDTIRLRLHSSVLDFIDTLTYHSSQESGYGEESYNRLYLQALSTVYNDSSFKLDYLGIDGVLLNHFISIEQLLKLKDLSELDYRYIIESIHNLYKYIEDKQASGDNFFRRQIVFRKYLLSITGKMLNDYFYLNFSDKELYDSFIDLVVKLNQAFSKYDNDQSLVFLHFTDLFAELYTRYEM